MLCTVLSAKILMPRIYGRFDAWPVISWVFCDLREKKNFFLILSFILYPGRAAGRGGCSEEPRVSLTGSSFSSSCSHAFHSSPW